MTAPRPASVAQQPIVPTARGPASDRPPRPRHFAGPARRSPRVCVPCLAPIHTLMMVVAAPHVTEAGEVAAVAPPDIQRQAKGRGLSPGRPRWPPLLQPETEWAECVQEWCWAGESARPAAKERRVKEAIACGRGPPASAGCPVARDGAARFRRECRNRFPGESLPELRAGHTVATDHSPPNAVTES